MVQIYFDSENQRSSMSTNNSTVDFCNLEFSKAYRAFYGLILIVVAAVGTIGNSILSYFVICNTEMRSLINILLATMAVSDTFISFFCTPLDFLTFIYGDWIFGEAMCCLHSFLLSVLLVHNVTILVVISVDRYSILVHRKDRLRKCHVVSLISACTVFSISVSSPPIFDVGKVVFANEHCRQIGESSGGHSMYLILYSSLLFVLPCGLLLLAYVHIIMSIRKRARRIHPECRRSVLRTNLDRSLKINVRFKQRTFSTILYLYVAAMVCKMPLAISVFVRSLTKYAVCPIAHWIMFLTYLNSAVNPFIYAFKISEYWMMLTGKFYDVKRHVKSIGRNRHRGQPQNIYALTTHISSSII